MGRHQITFSWAQANGSERSDVVLPIFYNDEFNTTTVGGQSVVALKDAASGALSPFLVPVDPKDPADYMQKVELMYHLAQVAFETDSTRAITLMLDSVSTPALDLSEGPTSDGYHNLSHHGKSEAKLSQLKTVDEWHMKLLNQLFTDLKNVREDGETLLDRSMILYGSNLGNANTHVTTNLPTLFAGGGFRHGQHLAFDQNRNYPLPNLFVSMLQRMGLESDKFATSTGPMRGLDFA